MSLSSRLSRRRARRRPARPARPALRRPLPDLRASSPPRPAPWPPGSRRRGRVAVWATPTLETAVGVVAALLAGVPAVPLNPKSGERELAHIVADSAPTLVLAAPGAELPARARPRLRASDIDVAAPAARPAPLPARAGRRDARPDRLHLRHHRPAQGRRPPPPRRSPPPWTRWRTPGSGPPTTCSCTACRCSMCTA